MCGICGIVDFSGASIDPFALTRMRDIMEHRGPDDMGQVIRPCVGLGHRRLSIIDLDPRSRQPMSNEDGTVWVTFNGEIYNYRELRQDLMSRGHILKTLSDTETIVHLYEDHGEDFVNHINGMFAIGVWDTRQRKLILARDRLGIKPVYYCDQGDYLLFASETKSILEFPRLRPTLDRTAIAGFFNYSSVPGEMTCFCEIRRLLPGHIAVFNERGLRIRQYWDIPRYCRRDCSRKTLEDKVEALVDSAVGMRMISDVPVGVFLSGGVDSGLIAALMAKMSPNPVEAFSVGYGKEGGILNEYEYAEAVARRYGMVHSDLKLEAGDLVKDLERVSWHLDEPCGDPAAFLTLALSRFARQRVTVALSGLGADEFFGGYRRYMGIHWQQMYLKLPGFLRHGLLHRLATMLPDNRTTRLGNYGRLARKFVFSMRADVKNAWANIISYIPFYEGPVFAGDMQSCSRETYTCASFEQYWSLVNEMPCAVDQVMFMDAKMYLVDQLLLLQDKMSMAVSLEIREPFLDYRLVELAATIPWDLKHAGRTLKSLLKRVAAKHVPKHCVYREKKGFFAPVGSWLRSDLRELVHDVLTPHRIRDRNIFEVPFIEWLKTEFYKNGRDMTAQLYQILLLELWMQQYLDGNSRPGSPRPLPLRPVA